jgi:hypothetical protein
LYVIQCQWWLRIWHICYKELAHCLLFAGWNVYFISVAQL